MTPAPMPSDENERLATLRNYAILDTAPESAFDRLTSYAAKQFNVPFALVSLVDENRQWNKASCGMDVPELPRDLSFCSYTVLDDEVNYIPDASKDERLKDNPFVSGEPHLRFYAGAPLIAPNGQRVGSFCILDVKPRHDFGERDQSMLEDLAAMAIEQMDMRMATGVVAEEIETRLIAEKKSKATERQIRALAKNAPIGIALIDCNGEYLSTSNRWQDYASLVSGEKTKVTFNQLMNDNALVKSSFRKVLDGKTARRQEDPVKKSDGSIEYINWEMRPWLNDDGSVEGVVMSAAFVTTQVESRKASEALNELFNAVLQSMNDGVVACNANSELTMFNDQARKILGQDKTALPPEEWSDFYKLFEIDGVTPMPTDRVPLWRAFNGESVVNYPMIIAPDNLPKREIVAQAVPLYDSKKVLIGAMGSMCDVTESKRVTQQLRESEVYALHIAYHDTLTGLANRAHFLKHTKEHGPCPDDQITALLYIDLNKFKLINDTMGHRIGDILLCRAANIIRRAAGEDGFVARLGGDEFVILKRVDKASCAKVIGLSIMEEIAEPQVIHGNPVAAGASVGIAISPEDGTEPEELLRRADIAMCKGKADGVDHPLMFDTSYEAERIKRQEMEVDLARSLENGEMEVYYQPIVCGQTRNIQGVEALVRWNHPVRGQVSPVQFIPVAEESGFIIELGEWVLRTAAGHLAGMDNLFLSVNLSPVQFRDPLVVPRLLGAIKTAGLDPRRLEFEITESLLMHDSKIASRVIDAFKAKGIGIALDDFGTGYSSLSYIQDFPFDKVKIDRCFVSTMDSSPHSAAVVQCVVNLASSLGMIVTAEGVETESQELLLKFIGCQTLQGYRYAKPMQFADLVAFVEPGLAASSEKARKTG